MEQRSIWANFLDFTFSELVTTRIVGILYVTGIVLSAWHAIPHKFALQAGFWPGLTAVIWAPIYFAISVLFIRLLCEVVVALFRILDNTTRIAGQNKPPAEASQPSQV